MQGSKLRPFTFHPHLAPAFSAQAKVPDVTRFIADFCTTFLRAVCRIRRPLRRIGTLIDSKPHTPSSDSFQTTYALPNGRIGNLGRHALRTAVGVPHLLSRAFSRRAQSNERASLLKIMSLFAQAMRFLKAVIACGFDQRLFSVWLVLLACISNYKALQPTAKSCELPYKSKVFDY